MLPRPLKWSIPDAHPTGRAWTHAEREVSYQLAKGCDDVLMSGIPTALAASEYARRAVMLARIGRWPYLNLRFVDVLTFTGLRTNATKRAAPAFHAHVGRLLAAQVEANLVLFTRSPQTTTLLAVVKELSDLAHNRRHEDNPLMRQPNLFDGGTNG